MSVFCEYVSAARKEREGGREGGRESERVGCVNLLASPLALAARILSRPLTMVHMRISYHTHTHTHTHTRSARISRLSRCSVENGARRPSRDLAASTEKRGMFVFLDDTVRYTPLVHHTQKKNVYEAYSEHVYSQTNKVWLPSNVSCVK